MNNELLQLHWALLFPHVKNILEEWLLAERDHGVQGKNMSIATLPLWIPLEMHSAMLKVNCVICPMPHPSGWPIRIKTEGKTDTESHIHRKWNEEQPNLLEMSLCIRLICNFNNTKSQNCRGCSSDLLTQWLWVSLYPWQHVKEKLYRKRTALLC